MADALRRAMTLAEFLAWEERQDLRYEFDGFQPVGMTGGTINHDIISGNLRAALNDRLRGGPCRALGPNVKVLARDRVRYPDTVVSCTPQRGSATVVEAPVTLFEVVSEGSSHTDRIDKVREYLSVPTVQRYVILEQGSIAATVFQRAGDVWQVRVVSGGENIDLPEFGVSLPITGCYDGADVLRPDLP